MSIWRSRVGGHRLVGWSDLAVAALAAWVVPMVPGLALMAMVPVMGLIPASAGEPALLAGTLGVALVFSPLLSWVGLLIGVPLSVLCLARGWFGWGVALAVGAMSAGIAAGALDMAAGVTLTVGAGAAAVFRAVLIAMRPGLRQFS